MTMMMRRFSRQLDGKAPESCGHGEDDANNDLYIHVPTAADIHAANILYQLRMKDMKETGFVKRVLPVNNFISNVHMEDVSAFRICFLGKDRDHGHCSFAILLQRHSSIVLPAASTLWVECRRSKGHSGLIQKETHFVKVNDPAGILFTLDTHDTITLRVKRDTAQGQSLGTVSIVLPHE